METSSLIQILVFVLAALIVLVFIASGVHFVRAVYRVQLEEERERRARQIAARVAGRLREQAVELKHRDGVVIQQPDGAHDIALFVEPCLGAEASGPSSSHEGEASSTEHPSSDCASTSNGGGEIPRRGAQSMPDHSSLEHDRPLTGWRAFIAAMNSQGFRR